jgi:hypothetical protein
MVLYVLLLLGLLYVRGKPFGAEDIARMMFPGKGSCTSRTLRAFFAFVWTLMLPIALLVRSIPFHMFAFHAQISKVNLYLPHGT